MRKLAAIILFFLYFVSCSKKEPYTLIFSDKIDQDSICLTNETAFLPSTEVFVNLEFAEPNPYDVVEGTIYEMKSENDRSYLGTTNFKKKGEKLIKYYIPFNRYAGRGVYEIEFKAGDKVLTKKQVILLPKDER